MRPLKAIYYLNQFYAGIGGEDKANEPLTFTTELVGPAKVINSHWDGEMEVTHVIICGDNTANEEGQIAQIQDRILQFVEQEHPDVVIAGPAFNAGRYGVACARTVNTINTKTEIPAITGMWHENPAIPMFKDKNIIVQTSETAAGMKKALKHVAKLALKLAKGIALEPADVDNYFPTGRRFNTYKEATAAQRAVDMLLQKLHGEPWKTEVPLRQLEQVTAVSPATLVELGEATIAIITTGGLVPHGNPDKIKQAFATSYGRYAYADFPSFSKEYLASIHGGYDTTDVNENPERLIPLTALRKAIEDKKIGEIYPYFFTTSGVGTNIASSQKMGQAIAQELLDNHVKAAILTST